MTKFSIFTAFVLLCAMAAAQTSAVGQGSTSASTGVSAGQQGASPNAGASTDANPSANPQSGSTSNASMPGAGISSSSSLAGGTTILATLAKSVDAKKAKQGDEVTARAAQNVVSNGSVVIPRGSKLVGHVTDAKAREKGQNESSLSIAFDKAVLKNGQEVPLQASIRAIAAAANSTANSPMPDMAGAGMDTAGSSNGGMNGDMGPRNGGAMGGPPNSTGSTAPTVGSAGGNVGGTSGNTANGPGRTASAATGELNPGSQGVIGLEGLTLNSQSGTASVISSNTKNVKLDNGTQLLLQVAR